MDSKKILTQIDEIFHPESVAIVGVPREFKTGKLFLMALVDQKFPGQIYPVNPKVEEIDGLKTYPSVSAIPGNVDLAIILVPQKSTLSVVKECAAKGVKGAVLFTAGYKETGTEEGKAMEDELLSVAGEAGMRLIGPNGMGLYCPKTGLSFFPDLSRKSGNTGFISHSGSLANILGIIGPQKGIYFSKSISLGNECDLSVRDFLEYLGNDNDTNLIGAYIENIKDGPQFLKTLKQVSLKKPVILWKVGLNLEGSRAAASHTGAMTSKKEIWEAVSQQGGAIPVIGFEAIVDTLMGFSLLPAQIGNRVAIVSGPGGFAVSVAEACGREGLKLAELSSESRSILSQFIPSTGTSLRNPIDMGMNAALVIDIYINTAKIVASDPGVDTVVIVGGGRTPEDNERLKEEILKAREEFKKPFIMVNLPGYNPETSQSFCNAGLPTFDSAERAINAYAKVLKYQLWQRKMTELK